MSPQTIAIHFPDGAIRHVTSGTTPFEIASEISPRLAAASVVARLTPLHAAEPQQAVASVAEAVEPSEPVDQPGWPPPPAPLGQ